jgi:hypothetical protein
MRGTKGPALQALKDVVERQVRGRRAPAGQSSGPLGLLKERNSVRDWEGEAGGGGGAAPPPRQGLKKKTAAHLDGFTITGAARQEPRPPKSNSRTVS